MFLNRTTKVELVGTGTLALSPADHVATGGEGSVYRKGTLGIKLYTDQRKMARDDMAGKIVLLSAIRHPYIVGPQNIVRVGGKPAGFYMPWSDGEALSRVFTNNWRKRHSFGQKQSRVLVSRMREVVEFAHGHHAILVDPNELGWLVARLKDPEPRILDVDSWAVGKWPATAIMPSVRDWHTSGFTELTDWFAWGIVTFQVFTGIHPYKGSLDGYKPSELQKRMQQNASVFTPGVRLNAAVRDFSLIPGPLLDWYVATFRDGNRSKPPSPMVSGTAQGRTLQVARVTTTTTGLLVHEKLFERVGDPVLRVFSCGVALLESGELVDLSNKRTIGNAHTRDCEIVETGGYWLKADRHNGIEFTAINRTNYHEEPLQLNARGRQVLRHAERLFLVTDQGLAELALKEFGKPILAIKNVWGVMVNSTRWFDGVGVQDAMGARFLVVPLGEDACACVRTKELDRLTPLAAKAGNRFVSVIGVDTSGQYKKVECAFNRDYTSYSVWEGGAQTPELNMALLSRGVGATIVDDGELVVFVPSTGAVNRVRDKDVTTDLALANWGDRVVYVRDGSVWRIRMQ